MSTLAFLVNEDAELVERQLTEERRYARFLGILTLVVAALVVGVTERTVNSIALSAFISEVGSLCLYLFAPMWFILWRRMGKRAFRYSLAVYAFSVAVMALVDYTTKMGLTKPLHISPRAEDPILMLGFLMLLPWAPFLLVARKYPSEARRVGLCFSRWAENIGIGLLAGLALGVHLLTVALIIRHPVFPRKIPYTLWMVFYEFGIQSMSEELFFRGFLFNYLHNYEGWGMWKSAFITAFANVLIYMMKTSWTELAFVTLAALFYILTMAVMNALLYRWRNNILCCWMSNVFFSLTTTLVVS
ncbi:MAG: hypothetical protein DRI61_03130 [Chloroflexi bacterium]|nr:MAG: hypothetical protein DRI61_03130 [Chloroflexota bacterium]HDN79849.1 CPBP family intramembrane metalloprotease [Chloroflexota bacterium]